MDIGIRSGNLKLVLSVVVKDVFASGWCYIEGYMTVKHV
jgi:flagellar basal body L-ring protein FlgH